MPTTPRELRRTVEDLQDELRDQYNAPYCEVLHQEYEIPQTPQSDEEIEALRVQFQSMGMQLPDDSIKLTVEHRELHDALRRIIIGFQADGVDAAQMLSAGLVMGRRIGMSDAAESMKGMTDWNVDNGDDNLYGPA